MAQAHSPAPLADSAVWVQLRLSPLRLEVSHQTQSEVECTAYALVGLEGKTGLLYKESYLPRDPHLIPMLSPRPRLSVYGIESL